MTPQDPGKRVYAQVIQDQRLQLKELQLKEAITTQIKEGNLKVSWLFIMHIENFFMYMHIYIDKYYVSIQSVFITLAPF